MRKMDENSYVNSGTPMRHYKKLLLLLPLIFSACEPKDDPETVKKLEAKTAEVEVLETELEAVLTEIKGSRTTDESEELTRLKIQVEEEKAKRPALEEEISELEKTRAKAEKDLADYQKKYVLRPN